MSDALSDIAQDQRVKKEFVDINNLEKEFFKNPSREKAEQLITEWISFGQMRGGLWRSPSVNCERIALYSDFINGDIDADTLKNYLKRNIDCRNKFYFAVGGHGHIIGDLEETISDSLLAFHPKDYTNEILQEYKKRIWKYGV